MSATSPSRGYVDMFLETIAPWAHAYDVSGFSYLAVRNGSVWTLLHGRLFLRSQPLQVNRANFRTERIIAGHMPLPKSTDGHAALIESLFIDGVIDVPPGRLELRREPPAAISAFYTPFHAEGLAGQNRLAVLLLMGASRHGLLEQPGVDWELKAAPEPYESLAELGSAYSLGGYAGDSTAIEIVAQPVVAVAMNSVVSGTRAEPAILLAPTLDPSRCRLGYRVFSNKMVVAHGSFSGDQLNWSDDGMSRRGVGQLDIPQAAVMQCFASYADCAQHHYWIADPKNYQNPRRMTHQATDPQLEVLRDYLFEEKRPRKESRDFECGVALLAWMLGFSVGQIGQTPRLAEAPDFAGTTPNGDMLLVECTIGTLKADSKLQRLAERTRAVISNLEASGNGHVRVLSVIVTALGRASVEVDVAAANSAGIGVATKETLLDLLGRTVAVPDAQAIFDEAWKSLQAATDSFPIPQ